MRGGHRDAVAGEAKRGLDEPAPRQAAVRAPQLAETGRHAGHGARCGADGVVDELGAERHLEMQELRLARRRAEPRHGAEAVEVAHRAARGVEHDRVAAAEQPGHHRLCDARREPGRHRRIDGRAAVLEDLDPGRGGRRMAGRDACFIARPAAARASRSGRSRAAESRGGGSSARRPRSRTRRRRSASRARRGPSIGSPVTGSVSLSATISSSPTPRRRLRVVERVPPGHGVLGQLVSGRVPGPDPGT